MDDKTALWGTPVRYRGHHIKEEELEEMRYKVDDLADECLIALQERGDTIDSFITNLTAQEPINYDDPRIDAFIASVEREPSWLDWDLLKHGQHIFLKHSAPAVMGLYYVSLVGGFSAPKITKVLDATSYMTKDTERTFRRMNETFEMVIDCIDDDDALKRGNRGFNSVLKVRFLHSRIRLHLLKKNKKSSSNRDIERKTDCPFHQGFQQSSKITANQNRKEADDVTTGAVTALSTTGNEIIINSKSITSFPSKDSLETATTTESTDISTNSVDTVATVETANKPIIGRPNWNSKDYGLPINQEDMVITLLSFSWVVLDTIEKNTVSGSLTRKDEDAYLHLWRYIGYLIGVSEDLNPCVTKEKAGGLTESIILHLLHPDERSGEIARHVIKALTNRPPLNTSYEMHCETARALLGDELADALGLQRSFKHRIYAFFILGLLKYVSYLFLPYKTVGSPSILRTKRLLRSQLNRVLYPSEATPEISTQKIKNK